MNWRVGNLEGLSWVFLLPSQMGLLLMSLTLDSSVVPLHHNVEDLINRSLLSLLDMYETEDDK